MRKSVWLALAVIVLFISFSLSGCGSGGGKQTNQPVRVNYRVWGLCFGPYMEMDPNEGAVVSPKRISSLLDTIYPYTRWVRTYGATNGLENVPRLAKARGLSVACGCWLSRNRTANAAEVSSLLNLVRAGQVDLAIVGSEVLLRGDLTEDELISYIRQVKAAGVPTTTNDTWAELLEHPRVIAECDVVLANFYPYWEGISVEQAMRSLHRSYLQLKEVVGDKEIIVGEAGWPSDGNAVGEAIPSPANAAAYFLNFVSWARAENVKYFYFEAFDEIWKAKTEGPQGAHWGIWDQNLQMKQGMASVFEGDVVPDNWSDNIPSEPKIEFTYVPSYGTFANLEGIVENVTPADYRVAVYIYVNGWWTKPYWSQPLTLIRSDGTWTCDITTGGNDERATKIVAYLVPKGYNPPLMYGGQQLPDELEQNSKAKVEVTRSP